MSPKNFEEFIKLSNLFYHSFGLQPHQRVANKRKRYLFDCLLVICIIDINLHLICETIYVVQLLMEEVIENLSTAITVFSYIGFICIFEIKMLFQWWKREELSAFMQELQEIFPQSLKEEHTYDVLNYLREYTFIAKAYAILYMIAIWFSNLKALLKYLILSKLMRMQEIEQEIPYILYTPWEWQGNWTYYLLYLAQVIAGYTSAAGLVANDLLICACATQLIMHFNYICKSLREYEILEDNEENVKFLSGIIRYHEKVLNLSNVMNDLFGVPLLFNFMTSTFVICFVGFQMSIGITTDVAIKLTMFLLSSIVQVYLICHYGEELKNASANISEAVYHQDWHNADVRYKKMLVLVMHHAQRPVILKATIFLEITRQTATDLLKNSYRFFALLRTMYGDSAGE